MRLRFPQFWRWGLAWGAFVAVAGAAGFAVHGLYSSARREVEQQAAAAVREGLEQMQTRVASVVAAARWRTTAELAGFHVDGLAGALRRWNEANAHVLATFQWDAERGFVPDFKTSADGASQEELTALWTEFRHWRVAHPAVTSAEPARVGRFLAEAVRTDGNPALAAGELGYQSENLEMLSYAGRTVDPWAGWACDPTRPHAPWIFWYQPGPDAPVRGCFVDPRAWIDALVRSEWNDTDLVRLALVPRFGPGAVEAAQPLRGLPGWGCTARPGGVFEAKQGEVRLNAAIAAALLAVFLGGGALLAVATQRAAREAERKITFVAQVSHELRTPLTSIRMFADLLAAPELPPEKRAKFAGTISRESQRLGGLIERLLTFNALGQGRRNVVCGPVEVVALVRETAEEMKASLQAAGLVAEFALPATAAVAHAEASTLKQALLNLLDNAAKYARAGGAVRLEVAVSGQDVRVRVADRGPGVPAAIRGRLFEPFVQGNRTLTDKTPGVGLGLSIARGLLRQAGGDLVLVPTEAGATFEIRLPSSETPAVAKP